MTLTTQVQPVGACTTNVCAPRVDCAVTDCPDAPVSLTAGVPPREAPVGVTNTWNDGPEAGAGAQLNAHPMFQPATVVVNAGLVQLPCICVGPKRTCAGPAPAAVVVADPPAAVVVVDPPAAVVVVDPPAAVVVAVDPLVVGSLYAGALEDALVEPAVVPFSANPTRIARATATMSCHVAQLRLPLICSSPGAGMTSPSLVPGPGWPGIMPAPVLEWGGSDMSKRWPGFGSPSRQPCRDRANRTPVTGSYVNRGVMLVKDWRTPLRPKRPDSLDPDRTHVPATRRLGNQNLVDRVGRRRASRWPKCAHYG